MEVARVDPGALDAGAIGFRLAPRINAAGRLHRADAGLELLLTEDPARARAIAAELDAVNTERRDVETRMRFAAEALVAEQGPAPAYVLAAEGWHPGVIGIVAARIAERHHRPAVLIALEGEEGTGSGRSIPAFDLLGGLTAAGRHLERYGGHRAAAGLTIARADVDAFRESFVAHAAEVLSPDDLVPECRVDAVVPGDALTLALAEELERLAPFGQGNPAVSLLVPAAQLADPRAMGEGRHVAFTLHAGGARSRCVQFGAGSRLPAEPDEPVDAAVRLEANRWNGAVEPRLVLRHARPSRPAPIEIVGEPAFLDGLDRRAHPRPRRGRSANTLARLRPVGRARRATSAAPGSRGCSRISSRPATACSRSSRMRRTARARSRTASAASRCAPGRPSQTIPGWPPATTISWSSTRPRTRGRSPASNVRPRRAGPIWRGVSLSYALLNEYISGTSPSATRWRLSTAHCAGPGTSVGRPSRPCYGARGRNRGRPRSRGAWCGSSPSSISWSSIAKGRPSGSPRRPRAPRSSARRPSGPTTSASRTDCDS